MAGYSATLCRCMKSFHGNAGTGPWNKPRPLPTENLPVHFSLSSWRSQVTLIVRLRERPWTKNEQRQRNVQIFLVECFTYLSREILTTASLTANFYALQISKRLTGFFSVSLCRGQLWGLNNPRTTVPWRWSNSFSYLVALLTSTFPITLQDVVFRPDLTSFNMMVMCRQSPWAGGSLSVVYIYVYLSYSVVPSSKFGPGYRDGSLKWSFSNSSEHTWAPSGRS
jgi:hypothetical protein